MWECRKGLRPRRPAMASVNPIMRSPANAPSTCPPVSAAKTKSGSGTMSTSAEPQTARSISIQEANSERPEHARTATSSGVPSADLACFATVVIESPRLVPFQLDPARGSAQRACDWLWGGLVENLVQTVGTALGADKSQSGEARIAMRIAAQRVWIAGLNLTCLTNLKDGAPLPLSLRPWTRAVPAHRRCGNEYND